MFPVSLSRADIADLMSAAYRLDASSHGASEGHLWYVTGSTGNTGTGIGNGSLNISQERGVIPYTF
jgi:hypothetical protein